MNLPLLIYFVKTKLLIFLFSLHCMTFISHANLKDFFDLPFFPGNINTNSLDGTVNIRLYHRTKIFQNQFHCITAHSNIPANRMTQAIRRISMGLIVVKFSTLVFSNSWHRLLLRLSEFLNRKGPICGASFAIG